MGIYSSHMWEETGKTNMDKLHFPQLVEELCKYYNCEIMIPSHYKIINDDAKFKQFIEWLPELQDGEQFYYALFGRKKYLPKDHPMKSDKAQLARGVTTKDRLYDKIKKLEVRYGSYKFGNITVPQEALALYIHPNPRSMKKASLNTIKMLVENIGKDRYQNPKSVSLNALQTAKSRTVFVDFDFDINNSNYDTHIKDIAKEQLKIEEQYDILKTRGGYHVLVRPDKTLPKTWHQNLTQGGMVDQSGDLLLPVPGCVQGDFTPHFI